MKQVILNIKEHKFQFFMDMIKKFDFIQVLEMEEDSKETIVKNIEDGFKEMRLYKEGKLTRIALKDFLGEV